MTDRESPDLSVSETELEAEAKAPSIRPEELLDALLSDDGVGASEFPPAPPGPRHALITASMHTQLDAKRTGPVSIGRPVELARPAPSDDDEIDALLEAALPSILPPSAGEIPAFHVPRTYSRRPLPSSAPEDLPIVEPVPALPVQDPFAADLNPAATLDPETLPWRESHHAEVLDLPTPLPPRPQDDDFAPPSFAEEALTLRRTSRPPPLPRNAQRILDGERRASAHIEERGAVESWAERAAWLEQQALATTEPNARARLLVVASELWAMVGDPLRGRKLANQACSAGPKTPFASRQQRWFAATEQDWKSVASALEVEARAAASPESQAHAAYYASEIQRLIFSDESQARRKLELVARLNPADARALLPGFLDNVGGSQATQNWPEDGALNELQNAALHMVRARTDTDADMHQHVPMSVAFQQASRALGAGRADDMAVRLEPISQSKGLKNAALWLRAAALSHTSATRSKSTALLLTLRQRKDTPLVFRALVHRAIESGNSASLAALLADSAAADALSVAERVALGALDARGCAHQQSLLAEARSLPELAPLVAAVTAVADDLPLERRVFAGDETAVWQARLAHALAECLGPARREPLPAVASAFGHPGAPESARQLISALELEYTAAQGDLRSLAEQIASEAAERPDGRARRLTAAILYEAQGQIQDADNCYSEVLRSDTPTEAVARALFEHIDSERAARLLVDVATATEEASARALLLTEAAVKFGPGHADYATTLEAAFEAEPALPFAEELRQRDARLRDDTSALLELTRETRLHRPDPSEQSQLLLAEAWLVWKEAPELAASLLEQACAAVPEDLALGLFRERWGGRTLAERARLREQLGNTLVGAPSATLKFSAALLYAAAEQRASSQQCLEGANSAEPLTALVQQKNERVGPELQALDECARTLKENPTHLPSLYNLRRQALAHSFDFSDLRNFSQQLTDLLEGDASLANAWLTSQLSVLGGHPELSEAPALRARANSLQPLWAERRLYARAWGYDPQQCTQLARGLLARAVNPLDCATLALRAAESALAAEHQADALELIEQGLKASHDHFGLLVRKADLMERLGDYTGAAEAWECLGRGCRSTTQEHRAWRRAAMVWQDHVDNKPRAILALSHALELDLHDTDTFARLLGLYRETSQLARIVELYEQRLTITTDIDTRIHLDVERCRSLLALGEHARAREGLGIVLELAPNQAEALRVYADLSLATGDFSAAEQAWLRVVRQVSDPLAQAEIYLDLGRLYEGQLPNPERAEVAFNEVLKRNPADERASQALAQVYGKLGQTERALKLATQLLEQATHDVDKQARTIALAWLQEHAAQDLRKAQTTLERARRQWPQDPETLRAIVGFYERSGQTDQSDKTLQGALSDARRAISTGRFDRSFFILLATAAELKLDAPLRTAATATLAAIEGQASGIRGLGLGALDSAFDDLLAPEVFTPAFRALLAHTSGSLESAYPIDANALRAEVLGNTDATDATIEEEVLELCSELGLPTPRLLISPVLGAVCMPTIAGGSELIFGKGLAAASPAVRTFLITRSLKLLMSHTAAFSRIAATELWPVLAGLLSAFVEDFRATGVDASKVAAARAKLLPHLKARTPELIQLASNVAETIGNRAGQLSGLAHQWANRAALLAHGDPRTAMEAIALAGGQHALGDLDQEARVRFLMRHNETRDLAVFSVSDAYTLARARL